MTSQPTIYDGQAGPTPHEADPIASVIQAWLTTKARRTGSRKAEQVYGDAITSLRALLQRAGLNLDGDPRAIALLAQTWAGQGARQPTEAAAGRQRFGQVETRSR